jgi:hypothetical protein
MSRRTFVIHDFDDPTARDHRGILKDGHGLRVPMQFADALGAAVARGSRVRRGGGTIDADRRQPRITGDRGSAPGQGLVCDAFGNVDSAALHQPGYRGLSYATDSVEHAELTTLRHLADRAYQQSIEDLCNAWRTDAQPPAGAYPLSAGEGSACSVNGRAGTLVREGDWLVCKPLATEPSRADAVPRFMDGADAEVIRRQAYEAYVADLCEAWRTAP